MAGSASCAQLQRGFRFALFVLGTVAVFAAGSARAQAVAEPEGYRMKAFRAPVPESLTGARTVQTKEAMDLHGAGEVVFIDVLPRPPRPARLADDVVWRPRQRDNIPGSVWLPNVGFGALNPEIESYFQENLARLTKGDKEAGILIYCLADCWMSWNAAKRALTYGYSQVYWYPQGTDGWTGAGGKLEASEPVPMAE
ncbi:PQQ-dependent catabolism-associated CXXCW motif protein [Denitrobaculum tricleocarpae]|uniref:PQQ-dependent catabolism-associated CXXCW motif protein n=1 Tax=Denitrobaculum tricleocarpae TaxID=2591009 RepID=A0A545U0V5_9PROT|nr:PQQ-dependent catabolism-associated CXXCW motif protein [Denitrobaculum tricleocarpae]TQV83107.1 PQQ-dependent catabolism-associated CXXCW motif protein [Denitrobaculum tricleocarpae]